MGLSWNCIQQLGALLAASEGYGGPFGAYLGAMLSSLGLSWDYIQQLGALLAACEGYGVPFGDYFGAMLGSLGAWGSLVVSHNEEK